MANFTRKIMQKICLPIMSALFPASPVFAMEKSFHPSLMRLDELIQTFETDPPEEKEWQEEEEEKHAFVEPGTAKKTEQVDDTNLAKGPVYLTTEKGNVYVREDVVKNTNAIGCNSFTYYVNEEPAEVLVKAGSKEFCPAGLRPFLHWLKYEYIDFPKDLVITKNSFYNNHTGEIIITEAWIELPGSIGRSRKKYEDLEFNLPSFYPYEAHLYSYYEDAPPRYGLAGTYSLEKGYAGNEFWSRKEEFTVKEFSRKTYEKYLEEENKSALTINGKEYDLEGLVKNGSGGVHGKVYKAYDKKNRRYVAIKIVDKYNKEIQAARQLQELQTKKKNINIVEIYNVGYNEWNDGKGYIVMEYVEDAMFLFEVEKIYGKKYNFSIMKQQKQAENYLCENDIPWGSENPKENTLIQIKNSKVIVKLIDFDEQHN